MTCQSGIRVSGFPSPWQRGMDPIEAAAAAQRRSVAGFLRSVAMDAIAKMETVNPSGQKAEPYA